MQTILRRLVVIAATLVLSGASALSQAPVDSGHVEVRMPSEEILSNAKAQDKYQYDLILIEKESLWDRIKRAFWQFIGDLLRSERYGGLFRFGILALCIGALALGILKFMGADVQGLFMGSGKVIGLDIEELEQDGVSVESKIEAARLAGEYREVVRLSYLQVLKELSDRELITWKRDKTNRVYVNEMHSDELKSSFDGLTRIFDRVWYGRAHVDAIKCDSITERFSRFLSQVRATSMVAADE